MVGFERVRGRGKTFVGKFGLDFQKKNNFFGKYVDEKILVLSKIIVQ
jgi:hypothetical protein